MSTLVIGGAGYLGSVLRFPMRVFDKAQGDDLTNEAQLTRALKGSNQVVHLAALGDAECNKNPEAAKMVNVEGTKTVVEAAERWGIQRLIFASSCSVYGWQEGLLDESALLKPASIYGQTKAEAEAIVLKSSIPTRIILRFAALFGYSPAMRFDTLFNQLVFDARHFGEVKVFEPDSWRPLFHVKDAAKTIAAARLLPVEGSIIINGACGNYQKRQIAAMISDWRPSTKINFEQVQRIEKSYRVDYSKMEALLGPAMRYPSNSIEEIV